MLYWNDLLITELFCFMCEEVFCGNCFWHWTYSGACQICFWVFWCSWFMNAVVFKMVLVGLGWSWYCVCFFKWLSCKACCQIIQVKVELLIDNAKVSTAILFCVKILFLEKEFMLYNLYVGHKVMHHLLCRLLLSIQLGVFLGQLSKL